MADDPMTVAVTATVNMGQGLSLIYGKLTGPTDYDASGGALCDLSSYLTTVYSANFGGVDTQADALVYPSFLNAGVTAALLYCTFTWDSSTASDGVFENVSDQQNLSGYVWYFCAIGTPPTRT